MELKELQQHREALEADILKRIQEFEELTEQRAIVRVINITHAIGFGIERKTVKIDTNVVLQ